LKELSKQNGMIIFAGKTGSGKTTSIYHLANSMSSNKLIMSIEDPVEIINTNFLQLQVNESADMGYDELIKVGLRSRP
ncbi:MAG: GspE family protein, partial [Apilactobacillus sp.]|nr:GspE family protein [Apilactobacillus sp.]